MQFNILERYYKNKMQQKIAVLLLLLAITNGLTMSDDFF